MSAADWIAEGRRLEQTATDGPWVQEWDTSDQWWTIHGQPNPAKGDERMVRPEVATLNHREDWTADGDFIADARTRLPLALDALEAVLAERGAGAERFGHDFEAGVQKGLQLARRAIETTLRGES